MKVRLKQRRGEDVRMERLPSLREIHPTLGGSPVVWSKLGGRKGISKKKDSGRKVYVDTEQQTQGLHSYCETVHGQYLY